MPDLSYPFVYECANCDREAIVTRAEVRTLNVNPDSFNAVEIILQQRGWMRDDAKGTLWCPNCSGESE